MEIKERLIETKDKVKKYYKKHHKILNLILGLIIILNLFYLGRPSNDVNQFGGQSMPKSITKFADKGKITAGTSKFLGKIDKTKGAIGSKLMSGNILTGSMSIIFNLVKSFIMFVLMVICLAVVPALPIFIFMLILFFILRARFSYIKTI